MTVIEVVLALLLLGVGLLAVAGMTLSMGTQVRRAGLYTDQSLLAQERLNRASARGWDEYPPGTTTESVGRNGTTWTVTETVTEPSPGLREVEVSVGGSSAVPSRTFTLWLARPRPLPQ